MCTNLIYYILQIKLNTEKQNQVNTVSLCTLFTTFNIVNYKNESMCILIVLILIQAIYLYLTLNHKKLILN